MVTEHLDLAQVARDALRERGVNPDGLVELVDGMHPLVLRVFGGPRKSDVVEPFLDCSIYGNGAVRLTYGGTGAPKLDEDVFTRCGSVLKAVQGAVLGSGPYDPLQDGPAD